MSKEYCNIINDECAFPSLECKQCLHGKSEAKEEAEMDKITTETAEHICDKLCQYPHIYTDQEELDNICCECKIGKFICDILNTYNKINNLTHKIDKLYLEKCQEVNKLMTELSKHRWIPCREGNMPEDILERRKKAFLHSVHSVLATGRYHEGSDLYVHEVNRYEDANNVWHWSRPFVEIIAWMPLPEPYKEDKV